MGLDEIFESKSESCSVCGAEMKGHMEEHRCANCGRRMCGLCVRKKGGFLGIGGTEYCPSCRK